MIQYKTKGNNMTKTIQLLRGTTAQNDAFAGAAGEVTVDTQTHELRVHDGSTVGGFTIPKKSDVQSLLGGGTAGTLLTNSGTPGTVNSTSIDATPTDGSNNPVSSNGVYDGLSSKADAATTLSGYGITDGANTDLSNLTDKAKNIGNWSSNVTNCITEIPQDIKLELNDGTLTLKAGSKVYMPNGIGVFNEITIANDVSITNSGTSGATFIYYNQAAASLEVSYVSATNSGTTPPTDGVYYDTSTNQIHYYSGGVIQDTRSLPIAIVQRTGSISSIDQIFNGFGYIGSTVFALPGVKGLIPNGRNSDGTLKNTAFTVSSVLTYTGTTTDTQSRYVRLNATSISTQQKRYYDYDLIENTYGGTCVCASIESMPITNITTHYAFRAVDYSDTDFIAHQAMPSDKYINLTLGASASGYTAPADGYFVLSSTFNTNGYLYMYRSNDTRYGTTLPYITNQWVDSFVPVAKGDIMIIQYNGTASVQFFRFIYANGAQ